MTLGVAAVRLCDYPGFADNSVRLETPPSDDEADRTTTGSAMSHLLWISGRLHVANAELTVSGDRPELAEKFGPPRR